MVALAEIFTQLATFADTQGEDWFKTTLVDIGTLEWSMDLLYSLK